MAMFSGCEDQHKTPIPSERVCPRCGGAVEVFTVKGRLVDDFPCACGYVFEREEQIVRIPAN